MRLKLFLLGPGNGPKQTFCGISIQTELPRCLTIHLELRLRCTDEQEVGTLSQALELAVLAMVDSSQQLTGCSSVHLVSSRGATYAALGVFGSWALQSLSPHPPLRKKKT